MDINEFLESSSTDEDRVIKELIDTKKNLGSKTDLSFQQIVEVCKLKHIARKYKLRGLDTFIEDFMLFSISKNRLGRKEFIEAFKTQRENKENMSILNTRNVQ